MNKIDERIDSFDGPRQRARSGGETGTCDCMEKESGGIEPSGSGRSDPAHGHGVGAASEAAMARLLQRIERGWGNEAQDPVPDYLGRYLVLERLSTGGEATVFLGWDPKILRHVAIKLLGDAYGPLTRDRVRGGQEASVLGDLRHPNLVQIYDYGEQDGRSYIVMELVEGRTLADVQQEERLSKSAIANLIIRLAQVVADVHSQGIVHLDLKPANVMIDERGGIRLVDFGLALRYRNGNETGQDAIVIQGTPEYMSPEQLRGEVRSFSPATDVFGLGAILFFLLTGTTPSPDADFLDEDPFDHLEQAYERLSGSGYGRGLKRICRRALESDSRNRFTSASQFLKELRQLRLRWNLFRWGGAALAILASLLLLLICLPATGTSDPQESRPVLTQQTTAPRRRFIRPDAIMHLTANLPVRAGADIFFWTRTWGSIRFQGYTKTLGERQEGRQVSTGVRGMELSHTVGPVVAVLAVASRLGVDTGATLNEFMQTLDMDDWLNRDTIIRICPERISVEGMPVNEIHEQSLRRLQQKLTEFGVPYTMSLICLKPRDEPSHHVVMLDLLRDRSPRSGVVEPDAL